MCTMSYSIQFSVFDETAAQEAVTFDKLANTAEHLIISCW